MAPRGLQIIALTASAAFRVRPPLRYHSVLAATERASVLGSLRRIGPLRSRTKAFRPLTGENDGTASLVRQLSTRVQPPEFLEELRDIAETLKDDSDRELRWQVLTTASRLKAQSTKCAIDHLRMPDVHDSSAYYNKRLPSSFASDFLSVPLREWEAKLRRLCEQVEYDLNEYHQANDGNSPPQYYLEAVVNNILELLQEVDHKIGGLPRQVEGAAKVLRVFAAMEMAMSDGTAPA